MQTIKKYDLYNENFEFWFRNLLIGMDYAQREKMPEDLLIKLERYIKGGTQHFSFLETMFILSTCLGFNGTLLIEDEQGMSEKEYVESRKAFLGRKRNAEIMKYRGTEINFVLASKNLFETVSYLNSVYTGDVYKVIKEIDFKSTTKISADNAKGRETVKGVARLLLTWERNKKKISLMFRLKPAHIYALLYFDIAKPGTNFYNGDFKYSYNANRREMVDALTFLHKNNYLIRTGLKRSYTYSLSAYGISVRDKIFTTLINMNKL